MKEIIEIILYYIVSINNVYFYSQCYKKLNKSKININFITIIIGLLTALLILINNAYGNLWIKVFLTLIIFSLNFKIVFKDNFKNIIVSYILIYITIIFMEIIVTNFLLFSKIINNNNGVLFFTVLKFFLSIIIPILVYLFLSINIVQKFFQKVANFFIENINSLNIAYILIITCTTLGMLNIENFATKGSLKLIILLFVMFLLLFAIIIKSKTKEEFLKKSNKRLIDYNEKYGQFLDEYKIYKHNIKNKLIGIKSYGNKKVNSLIDDLLEEETPFSFKNNNLYNIPNGIKGIVAEKLYNTNINVIIDNKLKKDPFLKLTPKEFNSISESIGICLDNAIEAIKNIKDSVIVFDLYENKENIFIKIGNNFTNDLDIDDLGNKYYSTKNRGSGFGLFSIMKNKIIKEKISIINNFYFIELQIKKHTF